MINSNKADYQLAVTYDGCLWLVHAHTNRKVVGKWTRQATENPPRGPVLPDLRNPFSPVLLDFTNKNPADVMQVNENQDVEVYNLPYYEMIDGVPEKYVVKGIKIDPDKDITLLHRPA